MLHIKKLILFIVLIVSSHIFGAHAPRTAAELRGQITFLQHKSLELGAGAGRPPAMIARQAAINSEIAQLETALAALPAPQPAAPVAPALPSAEQVADDFFDAYYGTGSAGEAAAEAGAPLHGANPAVGLAHILPQEEGQAPAPLTGVKRKLAAMTNPHSSAPSTTTITAIVEPTLVAGPYISGAYFSSFSHLPTAAIKRARIEDAHAYLHSRPAYDAPETRWGPIDPVYLVMPHLLYLHPLIEPTWDIEKFISAWACALVAVAESAAVLLPQAIAAYRDQKEATDAITLCLEKYFKELARHFESSLSSHSMRIEFTEDPLVVINEYRAVIYAEYYDAVKDKPYITQSPTSWNDVICGIKHRSIVTLLAPRVPTRFRHFHMAILRSAQRPAAASSSSSAAASSSSAAAPARVLPSWVTAEQPPASCQHSPCRSLAHFVCSGCNKTVYCSPHCQKSDWAHHAFGCRPAEKYGF